MQFYGLVVSSTDIEKWRADHNVTNLTLNDAKVNAEIMKERIQALIGTPGERSLLFTYPGNVGLAISSGFRIQPECSLIHCYF